MSTRFSTQEPIWTRRIANELWSGPVTPLTYSLLAEPMAEHLVRRPLRVAGLATLATHPVFLHHANHVYVNAFLLADVMSLLPPALRSEGLVGLVPEVARGRIGPGSSWLAGGGRAVAIALRSWLREPSWTPWQRAAAFEHECRAVRRELGSGGPFGVKPSGLAIPATLRRLQDRLGCYLDVVSWGMVFAYVFYHLLHELGRQWVHGLDAERAALTVGLPGIASLEAHRELRDLSQLITGNPRIAPVLAAAGPAAAAATLRVEAGPAGDAFRAFLARHGHRLTGRDLVCPTWSEAPALVVELATTPASDRRGGPAIDLEAAARRRVEATATIERALGAGPPGITRRALFRATLAGAQRYYALRENMRYHADFFLAHMRALALAAGAELVAAGRLGAVDDVFWLDLREVERALAGDATAVVAVAERRAAFARDAAAPPLETLADTMPTTPPGVANTGSTLHGESGAPGRCRGRARLVRDPTDFDRVDAGDVLVAVYTDPGWTPILERAAGLVLEAGGLLSHGAIVARELGIPALVGVADATRIIRDGDTIEIDAAAGGVTIVDR